MTEMTSRLRWAAAVGVTTVAALVTASPALAIGNGVPDGTDHPNVGLLAIEHDGIKDAWCSGFYAGPRKADPGTGVFVTAAHCLAGLAALGFSASDLTVTFDPELTIEVDGNTWATTATTWHPAFAYDTAAVEDYGVILLEDPIAGVTGVEFPTAHLLDASEHENDAVRQRGGGLPRWLLAGARTGARAGKVLQIAASVTDSKIAAARVERGLRSVVGCETIVVILDNIPVAHS